MFSRFLQNTSCLLQVRIRLQVRFDQAFSVKEMEMSEKTGEKLGMTLELPGAGKSPRHKVNLDKFRKESLRPNAEINSATVLQQCREFEEIWNGHMEQNREKWTVEQEKGNFLVIFSISVPNYYFLFFISEIEIQ